MWNKQMNAGEMHFAENLAERHFAILQKKENNSEPYGSLIKLSVKNPLTSIPDGWDFPWNWMSYVKLAPCLFSVNNSHKGEGKTNLAERTWEQQDVFLVK